ncbi:hypothetical protein [Mesorhizobium sp.]|uniref:hypothetical protein n=1 Tax=Mesorhizobium sp. TaxID=1871066 RepID=UPI000FEA10DF|nr:hypothetical protein [Mesorhizobium sp.]RWP29890.1 MAG: hypothetical protein EOR03_25880 [Mesorhizobium sp.]RWP69544.1 MAG: hypothetical protein EOR07_03185 [Mesorhizobium sp.]
MRSLRVLVACEFSGTVRNAFLARGHDAWSCDLLPSEDGSNRHIRGDARDLLHDGWDLLMVAHPPCTRLCNSGVRWLTKPPKDKTLDQMRAELDEGAALFSTFWNAPIERICIENPIMHSHAKERIVGYEKPAQIVQPWWFGEPQFKATGLYLKRLPPLVATDKLTPPASGTAEHKNWSKVHRASPGPNRGHERSRFFPGLADAMADQWGGHAVVVEMLARAA